LGAKTGMKRKKIILANPHGFCAGVERAVAIAESVLKTRGRPVYCLREIVHNRQVIDDLSHRGMIFVAAVEAIPPGATTLFSAHGVSPAVRAVARARRLRVIDATCPFVAKVHVEVRRYAAKGFTILFIGHRQHDEVIGVAGEAPGQVRVIESVEDAEQVAVADPPRVAVVTQTTLSEEKTDQMMAVLRRRFQTLALPRQSDICYATRNRQLAARALAMQADFVMVLGSEASSNSNRLVEVVQAEGCRACLVGTLEELDAAILGDARILGLTAGASTPESLVLDAIARLKRRGFARVEKLEGIHEAVNFPLPAGLQDQSGPRHQSPAGHARRLHSQNSQSSNVGHDRHNARPAAKRNAG